jgi:hypothetical protein
MQQSQGGDFMTKATNRQLDSKRIAVIRSYQPVRIERELLAQVFALAENGLTDGPSSDETLCEDADQATDPCVHHSSQHRLLDQHIRSQRVALEAVA